MEDAKIGIDGYSTTTPGIKGEIKVHEERLGKISLISNLGKSPDEIYLIYKEREDIVQFLAIKTS